MGIMAGEAYINGTETPYYRGASIMVSSMYNDKEQKSFYDQLSKRVDQDRLAQVNKAHREMEEERRKARQSAIHFTTDKLVGRGDMNS